MEISYLQRLLCCYQARPMECAVQQFHLCISGLLYRILYAVRFPHKAGWTLKNKKEWLIKCLCNLSPNDLLITLTNIFIHY